MTALTEKFDRALLYASEVHRSQVRKGAAVPYIAHVMAMAATVLEYGGDEDQAVAALLHDAVEDQGGRERLNDIRKRFGERVASLVEACSDSFVETGAQKEEWGTRKQAYLVRLARQDDEVLIISLSDKVHNARSILRDLKNPMIRVKVWDRFKYGKEGSLQNYRALANLFTERFSEPDSRRQLAEEFSDLVEELSSS